jgi:hypothetical protein
MDAHGSEIRQGKQFHGRIVASILLFEREAMAFMLFGFIQGWLQSLCRGAKQRLRQWTRPDNSSASLAIGTARDLARSKSELVLENALLRQQLIVLQRQGKRPSLTWRDRALFVLIAGKLPSWRSALMIIQPDTLLRWHRDLFRRVWRRKSKRKGRAGRQPLAKEIVALIKEMAVNNRTWGAKRIRGELLKLGIDVAKSTIQMYIREVRGPLSTKQTSPVSSETGGRLCATMPRRSGLVIFCKPMTSSSGPSLSSLSSSWNLVGWCISG